MLNFPTATVTIGLFYVRCKCSLSVRGKKVRYDQIVYKIIQIIGCCWLAIVLLVFKISPGEPSIHTLVYRSPGSGGVKNGLLGKKSTHRDVAL